MPTRYGQDAIEKCRGLYIKYGGSNFDAIEKEMRTEYPRWGKQNLSPKSENQSGWIADYGFEKSLELANQTKIGAVENDDERRYRAVVKLADHYQKLALQGDDKAVDKFIKLTDQQISLRSKLDLSSASFETFVEDFGLLVDWAKDIDVELAKLFYRHKDKFIEKAEIHFGAANNIV